MEPSKKDVADFLAFAPGAKEEQAVMFLKEAASLDEAVNRFYEDPTKHAHPKPPAVDAKDTKAQSDNPPQYTPAAANPVRRSWIPFHTNAVVEAGNVRAQSEQEMQNALLLLQQSLGIYNSEIEPEHETDYYCSCRVHQYKSRKLNRLYVQDMWSRAVMYPGEKSYDDCNTTLFSSNPYTFRVVSPYGPRGSMFYGSQRPHPRYHAMMIQQTINLNATLNAEAQAAINAREPPFNIWQIDQLDSSMANLSLAPPGQVGDKKSNPSSEKGSYVPTNVPTTASRANGESSKSSRFSGLKKALAIKSSEEKLALKKEKMNARAQELRNAILQEEYGRWPDQEWRQIVTAYQEKVGMTAKIADLRTRHPTQYLHLLRAGYFEPIPVAWANLASNPLKFSIEASAGWRGITPTWRGYEDTAEERLYWVLNHREGSVGQRLKPDMISAMRMARARMASAVEPPPVYFSPNDVCHLQHTSDGYSKQVMPPPFRPYDAPEVPTDDTMILLDVSGSMDFDPLRPNYDQYLITGYTQTTQPKNKDVAKAIIRRFTDAMANHDHNFQGYQLTTFSSQANYIGVVNHRNFDNIWSHVRLGGGTRVMTGWQKVKELHFQKHSESATYHPVYGWQAGPQTPMLRLLLLLDGEATDMDEFELDLLSLSWVHVTIFLIGVDNCPHHHRHANELQRISEVNHHVSFIDAQGNTPERFVTHELLKRHLGYDISMSEFEAMEQPPPYSV